MQSLARTQQRALIIGGSLGGLFAGTLLRAAGWTVDIYERSPNALDSRGGGIVLQPQVLEAFRQAGIRYYASIGVEARERIFLDRDGGVADRIPMRQVLTSWTSLYSTMRRHFPAEHYHQGAELARFDHDGSHVVARPLRRRHGAHRRTPDRRRWQQFAHPSHAVAACSVELCGDTLPGAAWSTRPSCRTRSRP